MATFNGKSFTDVRNINLRGGATGPGLLRWSPTGIYGQNSALWASNPFSTTDYGLYINAAGALVFSSKGTATVLGTPTGGGNLPTWDQIFVGDQALDVLANTMLVTSSGTGSNDIFDVSSTAIGSGNMISISNGGTGKDISGTSATWTVDKTGAAVFVSATVPTIVATTVTGTTTTLTLAAQGSSAVVIGTGSNTVTLAKATTLSSTLTSSGSSVTTGAIVTVTTSGTYTGTGILSVAATAATTGTLALIAGAGLTTGKALTVSATAATLTTGRYFSAYDGTTEVFGIGTNGHLISTQSTAPTIATNATGISAAAVTSGSTDTCGTITTTGTPASGTVLTITFGKTYTSAPKFVTVEAANASAGGVNTPPIVTQTATTFILTWPAGGVYAATPSFTYLVVA
jgi:hypothetical protein